MRDFIASEDRTILERHGLANFEALWALQLEAVDEPNTERGGWSSVYRLELNGSAYYLKRQSNHLTRSLLRPLGEPTFSREFRNIRRYSALRIPALQAAYFAERKVPGERRAVLLTRALDGWQDLDHWLQNWERLGEGRREAILVACAELIRRLHEAGQVHGCLYPKHIFLREQGEAFDAQFIDLEKTRPLLFGERGRVRDLEPLLRRINAWSEADVRRLLAVYLGTPEGVEHWFGRLGARRQRKRVQECS